MKVPAASNSFEDIFREYYPRLCDYAISFLRNDEMAQDVVQDAFVVYLDQRKKISDHPLAIKSFLYQTVRFSCLNKFRRDGVNSRFLQKFRPDDVESETAMDSMIHAEVIGHLHAALQALPEGCALVLKLGFIEGLTNGQIAEELNISIHTVKSQKQRAIKLLKKQVDPAIVGFLVFILS